MRDTEVIKALEENIFSGRFQFIQLVHEGEFTDEEICTLRIDSDSRWLRIMGQPDMDNNKPTLFKIAYDKIRNIKKNSILTYIFLNDDTYYILKQQREIPEDLKYVLEDMVRDTNSDTYDGDGFVTIQGLEDKDILFKNFTVKQNQNELVIDGTELNEDDMPVRKTITIDLNKIFNVEELYPGLGNQREAFVNLENGSKLYMCN